MAIGPFYVGNLPTEPFDVQVIKDGQPFVLPESNLNIQVYRPDGTPVNNADNSLGIQSSVDGSVISLSFYISNMTEPLFPFEIPGVYVVIINYTPTNGDPSANETLDPLLIQIVASPQYPDQQVQWATLGDVLNITGQHVEPTILAQAQVQIEMATGAVAMETYVYGQPNPNNLPVAIYRRDMYFLKLATAYQAAWLQMQPDMYMRQDITNMSQDGVSATYGTEGLTLAPLARNAIVRLSWKGTRSIAFNPAQVNLKTYDEWVDNQAVWRNI